MVSASAAKRSSLNGFWHARNGASCRLPPRREWLHGFTSPSAHSSPCSVDLKRQRKTCRTISRLDPLACSGLSVWWSCGLTCTPKHQLA